jgi:hypothetical protein
LASAAAGGAAGEVVAAAAAVPGGGRYNGPFVPQADSIAISINRADMRMGFIGFSVGILSRHSQSA